MDKDALFLFISRFVRDVVSRDVIPMVVDTIVRHRIKISEAIVEKLENWGVAKGFLQEYMEDPNIEVVVGHHPESSEFADNSGKEILDQSSKAESFSDSKDEDNIDSAKSVGRTSPKDELQIEKFVSSLQLSTISEESAVFDDLPPMQVVFNQRWIYLSGLPKDTTVEEVLYHLNGIWPDTIFTVNDLKLKGYYSAFKVGCKDLCYYELLDVSRWPEGVIVDIFKTNAKFRQPNLN